MKATAIANSNIALVKYWGKRNEEIILPQNSSISMTLDSLHTTTTVEFSKKLKEDSLIIDGKKVPENETEKVSKHLGLVRKLSGKELFAKVESENNFPKAAGLASSASGFAALSLAATKAFDLHLDKKELSVLARQGSGSASRSIFEGFAEWLKGSQIDGSDSYAKQIAPKDHWPELTMVIPVLTTKEKKIKSRAGMTQTVANSPLYQSWLDTIESDLDKVREGILEKRFSQLGKTAELNALKMHSTMLTTDPHIIYWEPQSITMMKEVMLMREEGIEAYFTIDGGPQIKILCLDKNAKKIENRVKEMKEVKKTYLCKAGDGAKLIDKDLF
ncbi:MAG: diphosphomevalonate decarboxylase [Candidatus Diapherotrites archaeon]|uniref:Diphosphomevalonate decarboxylase n=1 Tax=Candidatus Iainarchaeum sp. TaxID=3101447 RepID=A0A2D6LPS7_9ARCH|nr:diphosphomevalonate decarboxylase [Candidatus Diapherotrites archaeon]|tara:strand:- start:10709 stop:11701 length:993 start_codon:yes stop_codon:yes gene_type:complete